MRLDQLQQQVATDNDGVFIPINDPDGEPYASEASGLPGGFDILGMQSDARQAQEELESQRLAKKGGHQNYTLADWRRRRINLAASCCVGLQGWDDKDGKPVPFSLSNVKTVLQIDDRILTQVEEGIARHSALFKKASTN